MPSAWAAPYVWVTTDGTTAKAHVGELIPPTQDSPLPDLKEPQAALADGKEIAAQPDGQGYDLALPAEASGDVRFTAKSLDGKNELTLFSAKAGRSETKPVSDLELVPTEPGGSDFRLLWKGKPVDNAVVSVQTSAGWRRTLRAGPDGTVSLASPEYPQLFPSTYVLTASVKVNDEMKFEGKSYQPVRYTATLAFKVPK
ncbi:hypothetical protein [Bordetella petrii]|uniref:hypothetical protein n=1 Tax=Bordetella petrii TaxID=94624 RepID=UPI001E3FD3F1|nr:hypothetical protein [Bordetella petrii]MCD0505541.1 hypothetical protein [Bordetella petrii]